MVRLSPKEIREKWEDDKFPESFSGITTFRNALKAELNYSISLSKLRKIMRDSPQFLDSIRKIKKFKRRHLQLSGNLQLFQADIGFFNKYHGYRYGLFVIDCFSNKIAVRTMKRKNGIALRKNLEDIFDKEYRGYPHVLESDQVWHKYLSKIVYIRRQIFGLQKGGEFISKESKEFFDKRHIKFHLKFGVTKAFRYGPRFVDFSEIW